MSKKGTEVFQTKITRNDRFAQMSHQEKVIEQKKREIQAKLEQKQKGILSSSETKTTTTAQKGTKSPSKAVEKKPTFSFNVFSNDGSFLDQFKQLKDKKYDQKGKFSKSKDNNDKQYHDERSKGSRWSQRREPPSPKERSTKGRSTRFDMKPSFEPKININASYSNLISQNNFEMQQVTAENVTGQPLLKNIITSQGVDFPGQNDGNNSIIAAPPLLLNVPPPQVIQTTITGQIIQNSTMEQILGVGPPVLTTVNINRMNEGNTQTNVISVPPPCMPPQIELSSIPPPNPIQVHNIPQPEPLNAMNIPHPAPLQVQNIPPPSPIQLNEIPNPKPLDLMNIPTPNENLTDADFIKNVPPPNKSVPPPNIGDGTINVSLPPPTTVQTNIQTCLPPPNIMPPTSIPPPQNVQSENINQSILIHTHTLPPMSQAQTINTQTQVSILNSQVVPPPTLNQLMSSQNTSLVQSINPQSISIQQMSVQGVPPPNGGQVLQLPPPQNFPPPASINMGISLQNQMPVNVIPPPAQVSVANAMVQQIIPQTMNIPPPATVNMNCPPPMLQNPSTQIQGTLQLQPGPQPIQGPPQMQPHQIQNHQMQGSAPIQVPQPIHGPQQIVQTSQQLGNNSQPLPGQMPFVNQPPPMTSQMPPMNVPPPNTMMNQPIQNMTPQYKDLNTVFPPGTAHYEAMASLGRMVAQCGPGIEDIVKQKKPQDPNLWFLFHKESAAYQQYQQIIQQYKMEFEKKEDNYKPEDLYEPEMAIEEDKRMNDRLEEEGNERKRRRKSRWGDKANNVPPPTVVGVTGTPTQAPSGGGNVMLSKITRSDPGLIQYVINTYGNTNISEEDWKKAEDSYKINILYQDMMRKKNELERLQKAGKNKYEYDSDEEIDGGTWEHKLREKEMMATQLWAQELTRQAEGKHHIGDFLPPEELKKFLEKSSAVKEGRQPNISDYKEFKLKEDNIGFKMLQKFGWSEGQGLGSNNTGIVEPVNKAAIREQNQGLGLDQPENLDNNDDEYDAYRKRMMLAYRFRPNPLNNPRRPYY